MSFGAYTSGGPDVSPAPDETTIKHACEFLAEIGVDWDEQSYLIFQPLPDDFASSVGWVLHWNTIPIAIPPVQYSTIAVNSRGSLMLLSADEDILVTMSSNHYGDFSISSLLNGNSTGSQAQPEYTYLDMFRKSLSLTPDDINCNSPDQVAQLINISALLMKPLLILGSGTIAYDSFGPFGGILVRGTWGGGVMSEIYIEAPSDPNTVIKIGYKTGDTSPYADFYQSMGEDVPPAKDMSDWLLRLDHLIESLDIPAIKLLAEANGLKFLPLDLDAEEVIQEVKDRPQDFEPILEKYR